MNAHWPATDVIEDVRLDPNDSLVTARTRLYLQGSRRHVHTATVLIAADLIFARLLREGERLPGIRDVRNRKLSNRNLVLTASDSGARIPRVPTPVIRGSFRTDRGRTLYIEGAITDEEIRRRHQPPGIFTEMMERMQLEDGQGETLGTRLDPLGRPSVECTDPVLTRHAIIEFVLEGTRQRIRERFDCVDGQVLVVAGWKRFTLPRWEHVARGCRLEYRLSEGGLSREVKLLHCDFSFASNHGAGRLTIARIPAVRMRALEMDADSQGAVPADHSRGYAPQWADR